MVDQLSPGSLLAHNEQLYIVESFDGETVSVGRLGGREVSPKHMFDVGSECPLPTCNGTIEEVGPGERRCSNECLQWTLNHRVEGEPCPSCDDGTVIEPRSDPGKYTVKCTSEECGRYKFGSEYWRESWWPSEKYEAIDHLADTAPFSAEES